MSSPTTPVRRRCTLVAPGSDERKIAKALESAADEVVLDLEDAVTSARKDEARALVCRTIRELRTGRSISVRVNGLGTEWARDDLRTVGALDGVGIVLPKVDTADDLITADRLLAELGSTARLQALVETPQGVRSIDEICSATGRLEAVVIGYADLGAALGRVGGYTAERWLHVQDRILIAARAAGIQAIDGPHLSILDDAGFRAAAQWTRDLGFDGKWVIHPGQIDATTEIFTPTSAAVEHARRVLDAMAEAETTGAGAAQLDGHMLDEAVAVAARRVLAQTGG
ncbi:CoA ester lyase [Rhodococcus sp. ABRD24]|uniref:HpcH/HpaI aldolase/citrate lyase family protein n=1 Tax=Rhodococcus sp. ABRD24 TaxID=2507582 RepID=UPI00103C829B|nr:CoA ester lyase [Rhodococcus sp. ABRD24]QBJ97120.1 CoA ester lyase [Rhodococcus sp. ABRD24]